MSGAFDANVVWAIAILAFVFILTCQLFVSQKSNYEIKLLFYVKLTI